MPSDVVRLTFFLVSTICFHHVPSDVGRLKFFLVSFFCSHCCMVNGCVVFCYVFTIFGRPRLPLMAKLLLHFLVSQPVETHVHSFGPPWSDGVVDNSEGLSVVGLHGRRWLCMSHRNICVADGDGFAEIDVEGTKIGLDGG